jgi:mannose-6-phosphate isomerase-like protein (cupin superfamily)
MEERYRSALSVVLLHGGIVTRAAAGIKVSARSWARTALLVGLIFPAACGTPTRTVFVAAQQRTETELLAAHRPDLTRNITAIPLDRSERSSRHLVYIRDRERPHIHATHDLVVTLLRGRGTVWINGVPVPMRTGDVAVVNAGVPHFFVNQGDEPAAALVVFAPPSDGTDQVFLDTDH